MVESMTADQTGAPTLRFDVVAGLTAAAVVLPKAMAYATVAGLPVAVGLYTAFVPMVATGVANLGGALLGAMPAGGGTSQTAVVRAAGGRSQKASLVTAGVAAATMLLLAPLLGLLPHATLAAVVIVYSVGLIQPVEFRAIRRVRTMEFRWAIVALLGVLVFEYSALHMLMEREKRVTDSGVVVWLVGMNPGVLEVVRKAGLDERLGRERMLFNARVAIERFQGRPT
jgi:MFS superfamily sulfate permease-like transporter